MPGNQANSKISNHEKSIQTGMSGIHWWHIQFLHALASSRAGSERNYGAIIDSVPRIHESIHRMFQNDSDSTIICNIKVPLLKDKIITDGALTVIKATSQNNLLGKDYEQWDGSGDGWTPFGQIQNQIERMQKHVGTMVHTQIIIGSEILEQLYKCTFHLDSRKGAMERHQNGLLIPREQQMSIWTDGSFNLESEDGSPPVSGAASIVRIMDIYPGVDSPEVNEYISQVKIHNARSSYECEIIALHIGLDSAIEQKTSGKQYTFSQILYHVCNNLLVCHTDTHIQIQL